MHDAAGNLPPDVAALFLSYWKELEVLTPTERATANLPGASFTRSLERALALNEGSAVMAALRVSMNRGASDELSRRGRMLAVMKAIDKAFYAVHPRAVSFGTPYESPAWLRGMRDKWLTGASYYTDHQRALVPRGPLLRIARSEDASNAESLADRFAALAVVSLDSSHESRPIAIKRIVISNSLLTGVASGEVLGSERVAFLPVAEAPGELKGEVRRVSEKEFIDFRTAKDVDSVARISAALATLSSRYSYVDVVLAPELILSENDANELVAKLPTLPGRAPRLLISGSGPTNASDAQGMPWNETRVMNHLGVEFFRQRKIWPAGLSKARAAEYDLPEMEGSLHLEYSASGNCVFVADIEGFGRCIVLICQDVQAHPLAADVIRQYQPDWVFVPILDPGISDGRWIHQRTFELSALSQARFLAASSTSVGRLNKDAEEPCCGLAVGPKHADEPDKGRLFATVKIEPGSSPGYAVIEWRSDDERWRLSTLG